MVIPEYVQTLMDRLENAGFEAWAVGGCVRDDALGIRPHDYDLCTSALPDETRELFSDHDLVLAGLKHGTVGVITPEDVVEITTFRTEGDYSDNRHPGWVKFVPTIEEDLARRDFTVNAMAYSPTRGYADPFGGLSDLKRKRLRAVGDPVKRFREDALRILRGARFAARFGMSIEADTKAAMLSQRHLMDSLARERVFSELSQFFTLADAELILQMEPVLTQVIPELTICVGFDQKNPHHAYDVFGHMAQVTGRLPNDPVLRFAGILHDITKALDGPLQLTLCDAYGKILSDFSRRYPKTLHALTGSLVAERIFGENKRVVSAICHHTTGKANMNLLETIIYVADYMEPNRDFPGVERLRQLAYSDIRAALKLGLEMTLEHLKRQGSEVSPESREALAWLDSRQC